MRIIDIPEFRDKTEVLTCKPNTSVADAARLMTEKHVGSILILEDGALAGIFTERDLLAKVVGAGKDPAQITLGDVMTREVKTVNMEDKVQDSLRRMSQGRFRHLPIVDDNGAPVGMLSQGDFVAYTWFDAMKRLTDSTKSSFLSYTQVWMIILVIVTYGVVMTMVLK